MDKIYNKVVKKKKLQRVGDNRAVLIPKAWINSLKWDKNTELILEFYPYRKAIVITNGKEISDIVTVAD